MSMRALLLATKSTILAHLGLSASQTRDLVCDFTEDGRPKPTSGQWFYGIVGGTFNNQQNQCLDETYDLRVVITLKAGFAPHDRLGQELLVSKATPGNPNSGGIWDRAERLRAAIHMNYVLMDEANAEIGVLADGFIHPLIFQGVQYLGVKGPDWFDAESEDRHDPPSGVAIELRFGRAQRVQTIESQT
jgi:hypothetical protein